MSQINRQRKLVVVPFFSLNIALYPFFTLSPSLLLHCRKLLVVPQFSSSATDSRSSPSRFGHCLLKSTMRHTASRLAKFGQKEGGKIHLPHGRQRKIEFTFSFPMRETSIDFGISIKWIEGLLHLKQFVFLQNEIVWLGNIFPE